MVLGLAFMIGSGCTQLAEEGRREYIIADD